MNVEVFDDTGREHMGKLTGKVAVVTGASKGIGAGIARALGKEGANVVVNYASDKAGADKVVAEIEGTGAKAIAVGASVAKAADVEKLLATAKETFGKVDILVNNAGVYGFGPIESITEEEIARQFGTNVTGLLLTTKAALPLFPAEGGSIINIGSVVSDLTPPNVVIYNGTKGAVDAITRTLALELGPRKIRVNAVNPGPVNTEGTANFPPEAFEAMRLRTPLGRVGEPKDVADIVTFLASEEAVWVNGSLLQTAGGMR